MHYSTSNPATTAYLFESIYRRIATYKAPLLIEISVTSYDGCFSTFEAMLSKIEDSRIYLLIRLIYMHIVIFALVIQLCYGRCIYRQKVLTCE